MTWLDWLLLLVWVVAAVYGLKQRATRMVAGLLIVVVGFWIARPLAEALAGRLGFVSDIHLVQMGAAYLALVLLAIIAAIALGCLLGRVLAFLPLGGLIDHGLGLAIGLLFGLLVTGAILSGVVTLSPGSAGDFVRESSLGGFLVGPFNNVMAKLGLALP